MSTSITSFFKKRSNPDRDTEAERSSSSTKRQRKAEDDIDDDDDEKVETCANPKRIIVR